MSVNETLNRIENEVDTQEGLIQQIQTALAGKMAGGGDSEFTAYLNGSITNLHNDDAVFIRGYAFYQDSVIQTVSCQNVEDIGLSAFDGCSNLTSVNLPNLRTLSGNYAFRNNSSLESVDMPRVNTTGGQTFYGCSSLKRVNMPMVAKVDANAFNGCRMLESVEFLGTGNIDIAVYAFRYCENLNTVTIPNAYKLNAYAFDGSGIVSADFPKAYYIGQYAFQNCAELTSANFPNVTTLDTYAFYNCSKLASISIPKVPTIGATAFYGCTSLTQFVGASVTKVNASAFSHCTGLETVDLPKCTSILANAFTGCSALTKLIIRTNSVCTYANTIAGGDPQNENLKIYVPRSLVDSYKTATNWSRLADKFVALEDYTSDGTTTGAVIV